MAPGGAAATGGFVVATSPTGRVQGMLLGLALLARGKREGLSQFDATQQGFLASLAPWIAFALVDGLVAAHDGHGLDGAVEVAVLLCFVLLPPVMSEALAIVWRRDARWLRYITASTWCEWLMPLVFAFGWMVASVLVTAGVPPRAALFALLAVLAGYWSWLHFFLARAALDVSRLRAGLLVAVLVGGNGLVVAAALGVGGHARAMFGI